MLAIIIMANVKQEITDHLVQSSHLREEKILTSSYSHSYLVTELGLELKPSNFSPVLLYNKCNNTPFNILRKNKSSVVRVGHSSLMKF